MNSHIKKFFSNKHVIFAIIPAFIMVQTLFYKFTAHPDSVKLFTSIGLEPWGRISIGILELIAGFMLIINRTRIYGAYLGICLMLGAIYFHITKIGFYGANGSLFAMAVIALVCCVITIFFYKKDVLNNEN